MWIDDALVSWLIVAIVACVLCRPVMQIGRSYSKLIGWVTGASETGATRDVSRFWNWGWVSLGVLVSLFLDGVIYAENAIMRGYLEHSLFIASGKWIASSSFGIVLVPFALHGLYLIFSIYSLTAFRAKYSGKTLVALAMIFLPLWAFVLATAGLQIRSVRLDQIILSQHEAAEEASREAEKDRVVEQQIRGFSTALRRTEKQIETFRDRIQLLKVLLVEEGRLSEETFRKGAEDASSRSFGDPHLDEWVERRKELQARRRELITIRDEVYLLHRKQQLAPISDAEMKRETDIIQEQFLEVQALTEVLLKMAVDGQK